MISRLTAFAASFAILVTASLAFATSRDPASDMTAPRATHATRVIQLPTVVVVAKRQPA